MAKHINHFARAKAMFAAIAAAMAMPDLFARRSALEQVGEYRSRWHGGKHMPKGRSLGWGYRQSRSKYRPHQGKQECARRVRQETNLALLPFQRKLVAAMKATTTAGIMLPRGAGKALA